VSDDLEFLKNIIFNAIINLYKKTQLFDSITARVILEKTIDLCDNCHQRLKIASFAFDLNKLIRY